MQLEELLEAEGLDADATQRTLEWARSRAAEIVADMPDGLEVGSLLENMPVLDAASQDASDRDAAPVEALEDKSDLPPPPAHDATLGETPDMLAGVPDTGSLETLNSGEIEMLDEDELELMDDDDLESEGAADPDMEVRSVESGAPEPIGDGGDELVDSNAMDAGAPEAGAPDGSVDDDISIDLDLSDLDDL
jgi:hypothetical protein